MCLCTSSLARCLWGVFNRRMWKRICLGLLLTILVQPSAMAQTKVDLELILLADGSGSIDDEEFLLQRHGYARALRDPRIIDAIRYGPLGRIALSYVEWSGPTLHVPIVPWTMIRSKTDIAAFADVLLKRPRQLYGGGTAVGDAILYGAHSIETNEFDGRRTVIDISGDGPDRNGLPAAIGRDQAVAQGITVNGLPILEGSLWLNEFFTDNVIGGPGAFSIPARGFKDIYIAIRKKLVREIAGNSQDRSLFTAQRDRPYFPPAGLVPGVHDFTATGLPVCERIILGFTTCFRSGASSPRTNDSRMASRVISDPRPLFSALRKASVSLAMRVRDSAEWWPKRRQME
jgi:hypothetical protein